MKFIPKEIAEEWGKENCSNCGAPKKDSNDDCCKYCKQPFMKDVMNQLLEAARSI